MQLSESGLDFIKRHEGLRLEAYKDIGGRWTIGYGHLLNDTRDWSGYRITQDQANDMLRFDVQEAEAAVNRLVRVPLNQNQFDALVSWTYNLGAGNLADSTMLEELNAGNYQTAATEEMTRWAYVNGEWVKGLADRRQDEKNLFLA